MNRTQTILLDDSSYVVAVIAGHSRDTDDETFEHWTPILVVGSVGRMLEPVIYSNAMQEHCDMV